MGVTAVVPRRARRSFPTLMPLVANPPTTTAEQEVVEEEEVEILMFDEDDDDAAAVLPLLTVALERTARVGREAVSDMTDMFSSVCALTTPCFQGVS